MAKYADDTYLLVPSINTDSILAEVEHISRWALHNNLSLNAGKSQELMMTKPRAKKHTMPALTPGIARVESLNILGVTQKGNFSFDDHVTNVVRKCSQGTYALRTLKAHGLCGVALWEVAEASLLSSATYASQAWWGLVDASGRGRLDAMLRKLMRQGMLPPNHLSFSEICDKADSVLFAMILKHPQHVLHQLLPPVRSNKYSFRARAHNREFPATKDSLTRKTFITRMLNKNSF